MKKLTTLFLACVAISAVAQDNVLPGKAGVGSTLIKNATVHTGTGSVLNNTDVLITNGRIASVGAGLNASGALTVDASGKHVYPGFILPNTNLGLREIAAQVRGSNDYREIGDLNPDVRAISAYNPESKLINVIRSNGVLLANIMPQGSLLAGKSAIVQLDAWNYEDAAYKVDNGLAFYMPSLLVRPNRNNENQGDALKAAQERIEMLRQYLRDAKAYHKGNRPEVNLKLEAAKGLFDGSQKLFVQANIVTEILTAIDLAKEFEVPVVIVGGVDSWRVADLLKQNNIPVILNETHGLPVLVDDDIDQPYKTPYMLQRAGVLFAIGDDHNQSTYRNMMFNAGTAVAFGLTKEEALMSITSNTAKILGIADRTGTIEAGKDANIIISTGDALDMRTNNIEYAWIQGRALVLDDKGKQLYRKYAAKYNLPEDQSGKAKQ